MSKIFSTGIYESNHRVDELLKKDRDIILSYLEKIKSGKVILFRNEENIDFCNKLIRYFHSILACTFEKMVPITYKCENYVRFSHNDPRAIVPLYCDSVSFFPWNRDKMDLFSKYSKFYQLKNIFSGANQFRYIDANISENTTARIAAHFYPVGTGHLGCHLDPVGDHQEVTCTLLLSKPNPSNGYYLLNENNDKIYIEDKMQPGDFYIGSPIIPHGVDLIQGNYDPESLDGRWALLFPVNKTIENEKIGDSIKI